MRSLTLCTSTPSTSLDRGDQRLGVVGVGCRAGDVDDEPVVAGVGDVDRGDDAAGGGDRGGDGSDDPVVGCGVQPHRDGVRRRGGRHAPHPSRGRANVPRSRRDRQQHAPRAAPARPPAPRRSPPTSRPWCASYSQPARTPPASAATAWNAANAPYAVPSRRAGNEVGDQRLDRRVLDAGRRAPEEDPRDRDADPVGEHQGRHAPPPPRGRSEQGAATDAVVGEAGAERGDRLGAHGRGVHDRDDGGGDQVLVTRWNEITPKVISPTVVRAQATA